MTRYLCNILPQVFAAHADRQPDINAHAYVAVVMAAMRLASSQDLEELFNTLNDKCLKSDSWKTRFAVIPFLQVLLFRHCMLTSMTNNGHVWQTMCEALLRDTSTEVRSRVCILLSQIAPIIDENLRDYFVRKFVKSANKSLKRKKKKDESSDDAEAVQKRQRIVHGAVLGLAGIACGFPYDVPDWLPSVVLQIANHTSDNGVVGETARKVVSEFRRTHMDMWHLFIHKFDSEELDQLKEVDTAPSYYA